MLRLDVSENEMAVLHSNDVDLSTHQHIVSFNSKRWDSRLRFLLCADPFEQAVPLAANTMAAARRTSCCAPRSSVRRSARRSDETVTFGSTTSSRVSRLTSCGFCRQRVSACDVWTCPRRVYVAWICSSSASCPHGCAMLCSTHASCCENGCSSHAWRTCRGSWPSIWNGPLSETSVWAASS